MVHKGERACFFFLRGESGARFCFVSTSDVKSRNTRPKLLKFYTNTLQISILSHFKLFMIF